MNEAMKDMNELGMEDDTINNILATPPKRKSSNMSRPAPNSESYGKGTPSHVSRPSEPDTANSA